MIKNITFTKPFKVYILDRKEWSRNTHDYIKGNIVWFTDGSKTQERVGATAWGLWEPDEIVYSLDSYFTVFQAEIRAIKE